MIDFENTHSSQTHVLFCNKYGDTLKSYPISELEQYVYSNNLNIVYEHDSEYCGSGDSNDPRNHTYTEIESRMPVSQYLDENWETVTKDFYISKNPSEFKANNYPQQTKNHV